MVAVGQVEVAVMTCPRTPSYVQGLLKTMFERQDMENVAVRVVVDGSDSSYLGPWTIDPRVKIEVPLDPSRGPLGQPERIMRTFRRCLDGASCDMPLVLLQDDAEVAVNWLTKSLDGYEMARNHCAREGFFLALWSATALGRKDAFIVPMLTGNFFGNVGLMFSPYVARELRNALQEPGFQGWPDDMAVKRIATVHGWQIYNMNPSVVQHVGSHSTHGANGDIKSPSYRSE